MKGYLMILKNVQIFSAGLLSTQISFGSQSMTFSQVLLYICIYIYYLTAIIQAGCFRDFRTSPNLYKLFFSLRIGWLL